MKLRPMLRRIGWVLGTAVDTLGMAAGVFGLGAVARLRLWRLSRTRDRRMAATTA